MTAKIPNNLKYSSEFERLAEIVARLRKDCPWDREQTFDSIKRHTLEETYEVFDAIERRAWPDLKDELGDLLLQVLFYAQMASEAGYFAIDDVAANLNAKLIRRHPHIFAGVEATDADAVAAALREAHEEIGLDPAGVEVLGELPVYDTITGFRIHPVVGWIERPSLLVPDPHEVADLFEVPLDFALDPRNHERDSYERDGRRREFYVLRWQDRYIWGATAGILVNFARMMAD